ncbi:MAG TPA: hypothetical protein VNA30_01770 [Mycobacteriales bacterium]|nr:hypothetical protein [Mycobacteriales bacterium]
MTNTQPAAPPRPPFLGTFPALMGASLAALLAVGVASAVVLERRDPGTKVVDAAEATLGSGSAHLHYRVTGIFSGSTEQELDADTDFSSRRYVLGGDVDNKRLEARVIDGTAYLAGSVLDSRLATGKRWLRITTQAAGTAVPLDQLDPTAVLAALRDDETGEVTAEGAAKIEGEPMQRYRATFTREDLPENADIYIAADGLVRRLVYSFRAGNLAGRTVIDFSSYGSIVTVNPPNQTEVTDAS